MPLSNISICSVPFTSTIMQCWCSHVRSTHSNHPILPFHVIVFVSAVFIVISMQDLVLFASWQALVYLHLRVSVCPWIMFVTEMCFCLLLLLLCACCTWKVSNRWLKYLCKDYAENKLTVKYVNANILFNEAFSQWNQISHSKSYIWF